MEFQPGRQTYLGVGSTILDGEVGGRRGSGESGSRRGAALLAPVVGVDAALESNEGHLHCVCVCVCVFLILWLCFLIRVEFLRLERLAIGGRASPP